MKTQTKKIIIIVAVVVAIAVVVWLIFLRKKGWEKLIDNLNISASDKQNLKNRVKAIVSDSAFDKSYYENAAARNNMSYDEYLVMEACYQLGWPVGMTNGEITLTPKKD